MSHLLQLAIAIAAGLAAASLIIALDLAQQPLVLTAVVVLACCVAPLLSRRPTAASDTAMPEPTAVSSDSEREEGEVKWFNVSKGFGFIRRQNGEEIFVHFRSIRDGKNSETGKRDNGHRQRRGLRDGQRVSFVVVDSDKGPQAEDVEALR